jgi:hypothetical protein
MTALDAGCYQIFLDTMATTYRRHLILLFVDGAGNQRATTSQSPGQYHAPSSQEHLWNETREKIENYALKSVEDFYREARASRLAV